ncbi:MAG: TetR/AcrR family transcriptional regulator [Ruminococcus sp.]|nr:TetR/AcrR family transcriptional regulator [Ruminococcus sp.]
MGKLDVNKKKKEISLLNTAFDFFTTKGFSKTSITDIADKAGVAKGTFYLYFKDKYDIRNRLISHKSSQIFLRAIKEVVAENTSFEFSSMENFEDMIIKIIDNIVNQLNTDKMLLTFISKNLSWGIFKNALISPVGSEDVDFRQVYYDLLDKSPRPINQPEIMLFMIVEMVSSTCYSAILYSEPCSLDELKPHLYRQIRLLIRSFSE